MTDLPKERNGPHRGTIEIRNADTLHEATSQAVAWISEFLDGRDFVYATTSVPNIVYLGDGAQQVVGWEVTVDWRAVS